MLTAGRVGEAPVHPRRPVLIYDGECAFCRRWVRRLARLDRRDAIVLMERQDEAASATAGRSPDELRLAAHLVRPDGAVFAGAAAVREAVRWLRGGRLVTAATALPGVMPVAERVYAWVARRWGPVAASDLAGGSGGR